MKMKLGMTPDEVVDQAVRSVKRATKFTDNIEFSPEDAGRSDTDFLCRIIEAAINAGATTINIPDTVGYNIPHQFGKTMKELIERIPNSDKAIFSAHCHNDLGLAVSNSLSAVLNGARQIECTINGLGERAGNTSLEEVVMAVRTRQDVFGCDTNIDATGILAASRLVSSITGFVVQPNKAIVGANAFAHEAGIHQDGVLKNRLTYEIIDAKTVGLSDNRISLGKLSGRSAVRARLEELGYDLTREDLDEAFARFKDLADRKREITDRDLEAIVSEQVQQPEARFQLKFVQVSCGSTSRPTATVALMDEEGGERTVSAVGTGPVDAVCRALNGLADVPNDLIEFSVKSVTEGIDAIGEVTIRLRRDGSLYSGHAADTDVVVAAAMAFVNALNRLVAGQERQPLHPQKDPVVLNARPTL